MAVSKKVGSITMDNDLLNQEGICSPSLHPYRLPFFDLITRNLIFNKVLEAPKARIIKKRSPCINLLYVGLLLGWKWK